MSLPVPTDPNFSVNPTEDEFMHPKGEEDEALLATGAWDDVPDDNAVTVTGNSSRVRVHIHK